MIEIQNINPVMKKSLLATCSVYIKPWHMTLHEVMIFEEGARRWINLPSQVYEKDGEKKYKELITFDNDSARKRFRDQIMTDVDKFLAENPNCTPPDVIRDDSEFPF